MDMTLLIIVGALLLAVAAFVYVWFGARKLRDSHNARIAADAGLVKPAAPAPSAPAAAAPPAPQAAPAPAEAGPSPFLAAPDGTPDDLSRIKGIGPKLSARLAELGVFHYAQIAGWTPAQLAAVDAELGQFQGRPERDQWQSQARLLASGDLKAYERAHGKLGQPAGGRSGPPEPGAGDSPAAGA